MIDIHSLILEWACYYRKKGGSDYAGYKRAGSTQARDFRYCPQIVRENGYEKTSITDIAKAIGVAQGLCYRYFPSKEALFDSAIEQYADVLVEQFAGAEKDDHKTLRQIIEDMPATMEERDTKYYSVFHGAENKKFHDQLSLKVCEKLVPLVEKLLLRARQKAKSSLTIFRPLRCSVYMGSLVS